MITIKNKFLPIGKKYKAINLFGIVFYKGSDLNDRIKNHETIHSCQIFELFLVFLALILALCIIFNLSFWWILLSPLSFYIIYGLEYLIVRPFHSEQIDAYRDVSFEEEAKGNESNLKYLNDRVPFSWIKFMRIKSNEKK